MTQRRPYGQHPRALRGEPRYTGYGSLLGTGTYNFSFTGDKVEFYRS
ncbi:hypothetical protein ACIQV3_19230 [Streptomyces sp. NPDC099050]